MKHIFFAILATLVAAAQADDYDDLVRVSELGAKFEATGNFEFLYDASVRCAGMYISIAAVMASEDQEKMSRQNVETAWQLVTNATDFLTYKWDHIPTEREKTETIDEVSKVAVGYSETLTARLNRNHETSGEFFDGDQLVIDELAYCKRVYHLDFEVLTKMAEDAGAESL